VNKRIVGLDVGDKRIGVAVSDGLGLTAQPAGVIARVGTAKDIDAILALVPAAEIARFVAGLPLEMSGREGMQSKRVRAFCDALATRTGIEVVYQDERMTTVQSERMLIESGMRREKRRAVVDKLAATLILQAYLDARPSREDVS
jgi:putative Holliday junction resolvase